MTTTQTLEDGVRYVPGLCVTFPLGSKIDLYRFKDVSEVWIADVAGRVFDNPKFSGRKRNSKDFCVFSRGGLCGDNYRLDMEEEFEGQEDSTKPKMMTLDEAVKDCHKWYRMADTIGGDSIILHVPTGQVLQWEKYLGKQEPQSLISRVIDRLAYLLEKVKIK